MRKIFILFILTLSINVYAESIYTDYEYIGYTFEKKDNDELYKYESIVLNRYYKEIETGIEYLEKSDTTNKKIDEKDYKIEEVQSETKPIKYKYNQHITIKGEDNYICNKLIIKLLSEYENLKIYEIEVFNQGEKMSVSSSDVPEMIDQDINTFPKLLTDTFTINFKSLAYVDNLTIKIYFENDSPLSLNYYIHNTSGLLPIIKDLTLDNKADSIIINTLKYDKFIPFIETNNFEYDDIKYYYDYQKLYYKHYTPLKEYYVVSELSDINGYIYDKNESIAAFKIYRREKIDHILETDQNSEKDIIPDIELEKPSSSDDEKENVCNPDKIIEYVFVTQSTPCECEEKECPLENHNGSQNTATIIDTSKNEESIINLDLIKNNNNDKINERNSKLNHINWWFIIGLALLITSLAFTVVHYLNVKREGE